MDGDRLMDQEGIYRADGQQILHGPNFAIHADWQWHKGDVVPADAKAAGWDWDTDENAFRQKARVPWPEWKQPEGAHDAYPQGEYVSKDGKTWENLTPDNPFLPGVSGWREVVAAGYPAWVRPTGAHDAYALGARVAFNGANYESVIAANVWSPAVYPAGWKVI